jgi:hypothetical protein
MRRIQQRLIAQMYIRQPGREGQSRNSQAGELHSFEDMKIRQEDALSFGELG